MLQGSGKGKSGPYDIALEPYFLVRNPTLLLLCSVTRGTFLYILVPQFPDVGTWDNSNNHFFFFFIEFIGITIVIKIL